MPDQNQPLNVVLIMVDQWRGDCLGIAGHPSVHTPYLDGLALQGARFNCAYSATPTCIAARAALFTGLTQRSHGRVGYKDGVPWNYPITLAGEFTRHGYQTQAVGKMHVYPERSQLGFQNVILHDGFLHFARRNNPLERIDDYIPWLRNQLGREADYFDNGVNCNSYVARPWDKPEYTHPTNFVASQSLDFLRRRDPRKPFFLFMSFHRPHPPYDPPEWAFEQYLHQPMPEPPVGDWETLFDPYLDTRRPDCLVGNLEPHLLQRARAGYYGHMTHIDHQVNRFLEGMADYGVGANTLVCFVSDHGEMMGDHHLFRKAYPYEGSARIPLIIAGPGVSSVTRSPDPRQIIPGRAYDALTELRDVMPTLLDCAGLPIPESVEGRSLLPIMRGEAPAWREYIHGEHTLVIGQSIHWITDGREKYVWFSQNGHEQLFDLVSDPQEKTDLARRSDCQSRLLHWRGCLIQELNGREEGFSDGRQLIPGRPVTPVLSQASLISL